MIQMNEELQAVMQEDDQNSLEHYGVKGQKWGQRNYQNPDGTYTELGKERRRVGYIREEKQKEKDANAHKNGIEESIDKSEDIKIGSKAYKDMTRQELREARKRARHNEAERRAKREFNRDKREALENGDISFISRNISKFTNDEIDEAITRYNKMQNLKTLEAANRKDSVYFMEKAAKFLNSAEKVVTPITNISNKLNEASKKASEKRNQLISEKKSATELEYLKNPKAKPLTKKEEIALEKDKLELDWLKDPKSKPMTEKEELELQWLKDPKSKPKTRKEEIEAEKAEKELEWFYNPLNKPLTESESLKNAKQALENRKLIRENIQTDLDTDWKKLLSKDREADYESMKSNQMSMSDFKNKWGTFDNPSSGKGKGDNNNSGKKGKKVSEDDFREKAISKGITDEDTIHDLYDLIGSQSKKSSIGGWFSKKNKEDIKGTDFDLDDKRTNSITKKYLGQLKTTETDYFNEPEVRNEQWKKDLKKHDSDVIDDWVKDMKKKYMKERKMNSKDAEKKAEEYVDAWLNAYDEGRID